MLWLFNVVLNRRIHQLQEQIKNARQRDKIIDEQIEQDKAVRPSSDLSRQIEQLETRNKVRLSQF